MKYRVFRIAYFLSRISYRVFFALLLRLADFRPPLPQAKCRQEVLARSAGRKRRAADFNSYILPDALISPESPLFLGT